MRGILHKPWAKAFRRSEAEAARRFKEQDWEFGKDFALYLAVHMVATNTFGTAMGILCFQAEWLHGITLIAV
ncbi:unnamed protein product, partial [Amoebophrya sp. A25]|eukprot:GSA25T00002719001.1